MANQERKGNGKLKEMMAEYGVKTMDDVHNFVKMLTAQGNLGEMQIEIPRDRDGEFEPQLVRKHQTDVSSIEDKVIFL